MKKKYLGKLIAFSLLITGLYTSTCINVYAADSHVLYDDEPVSIENKEDAAEILGISKKQIVSIDETDIDDESVCATHIDFIGNETELPVEATLTDVTFTDDYHESLSKQHQIEDNDEYSHYYVLSANNRKTSTGSNSTLYGTIEWIDKAGPDNTLLAVSGGARSGNVNKVLYGINNYSSREIIKFPNKSTFHYSNIGLHWLDFFVTIIQNDPSSFLERNRLKITTSIFD